MKRSLQLTLSLVAFTCICGMSLVAQAPQPPQASHFEVATIKPGHLPEGSATSSTSVAGGLLRMTNVSLKQMVELGLSVPDYALKAPSWLETTRFDLVAKLPNQPITPQAEAEMVKALLVERFGLQFHTENQTVPGYELVPDKKVLLEPSGMLERLKGHGVASGPTLLSGTNEPMSELVDGLGKALGRPVVDATHMEGLFTYKLMWRPANDADLAAQQRDGKQYGVDVDSLPSSVASAVREQLGLRLQNARVPGRVVVVDKINRQPTEN